MSHQYQAVETDLERPLGRPAPLLSSPERQSEQSPWNDDVLFSAESPVIATAVRFERPSTPKREHSNYGSDHSGSPRPKSGIVFGTPRKVVRPVSNPFLESPEQSATIEGRNEETTPQLALPPRSLPFVRRVPDETDPTLRNAHVAPSNNDGDNDIEDVDEKQETDAVAYNDDDEELGLIKEKNQTKSTIGKRFSGLAAWPSRLNPFSRQRPTVQSKQPKKQRKAYSRGCKICLWSLLAFFILLLIGAILVACNLRQPRAHWNGPSGASTGFNNDGGFNFTRQVDVGFSNPNLFPLDVKGVEIWTAVAQTRVLGHARDHEMTLTPASLNRGFASLRVPMEFTYLSSQDADLFVLTHLYEGCVIEGQLPIRVFVRALIKTFGFYLYRRDFELIETTMLCDEGMTEVISNKFLEAAQFREEE